MTDFSVLTIDKPVLILVGPTAIGKTELSLGLANEFNCEIVSVDSMQVYRYMDIGTAKATVAERQMAAHHLIDIVDPDDEYNAARFVDDCRAAMASIHSRGAIPLLTGGTGLYLQALRRGLFPSAPTDISIRENLRDRIAQEGSTALHDELARIDQLSAARIHPNDTTRIIRALEVFQITGMPMAEHLRRQQSAEDGTRFECLVAVGLTCDRETLYQRINLRTVQLLEKGLEKEVRGLLRRGFGPELKSMQSIGYRHMLNYVDGRWSLDKCREVLARDTRRYAKRQYTWFGRDRSICWFNRGDASKIFAYVERKLSFCKFNSASKLL